GVGRAIVEKLAACGLAVAFTYHSSEDEAEQLAKSINGLAIRADLTKPDSAPTEIFHRFKSHFDRLDVLVNNASLYSPARLKETTLDLMRTVAAIHVQSPLLLLQSFERMLRQSHGHV